MMQKSLHIAFVVPRFSEKGTVGGAETLLKRQAELLAGLGHKVEILTTCADSHFTWANTRPPGRQRIGAMEVEFFPVDSRDEGLFLRIQQQICGGTSVARAEEDLWVKNSVNSSALYRHLHAHGPAYDAVITGPYLFGLTYAAAAIWPNKTLLVPCLHDEPFAYLAVTRDLFTNVAALLFNAEPERALAESVVGKDVAAKGMVVGMDIPMFSADASAFSRQRQIAQPYVIYSGRRESGKGTPLLCDYVSAFRARTGRDIKLVMTGSGPIEADESLQPHILDVGFVSEQEKHEAMAGAVAFIHPSLNESFGIVLLEAWLAGVPALVHGNSAVLRWQCEQSGAGLWFRNYPEFEEELLLLLDQPALRSRLGERGRAYVRRHFAEDSVRDRLMAALNKVVQ